MQAARNGTRVGLARSWLTVLLLTVLTSATCFGRSVSSQFISDLFVGHPAPDFKLKDLDGHEVQLSSLRGRVVLLDFWATWCGPCRAELPMIEHISKEFKEKNVIVIGIDSEEPADVVRRFAAKKKLTYSIVLSADDPGVIRAYAAHALPTVAVIDKNGIIAAYRVGENPRTEEILREDIRYVSSSKYVAPQPKAVHLAQGPPAAPNEPGVSGAAGPDPNWQPKTADEFLARGFANLRVHRNAQAKADAEDALKLHPDWLMACFLHGRAAYEEKDYLLALEDFHKVIQQKPDWPAGYHYRGLTYSYYGQHQHALPDYEKLIELEPYLPAAYNDLGWAYRELGQLDKAKTNLDKAIAMEPDYIRARENRAILFEKQSNWTAEVNELTIILGIAPKDQWAKDKQNALLQHQQSPSMVQKAEVQPQLLSKKEPEYSEEARRAGVSTSVLLNFVVNTQGVPENIRVARGAGFGLDEKAIEAVSTWRFEPATKQGAPVPQEAHVEVNFRLLVGKHENQTCRLNFTLPPGGSRPELIHGTIPANPENGSDGKLRIELTVGADGKPNDLSVVDAMPLEWAESALREMNKWRFRPATIAGQPAEVKGVFELAHSATGAVPHETSQTEEASAPAGPDPNWQPKTADEFLARGYARLRIHKYPQAIADAEDALKLDPNSLIALLLHARAAYSEKDYSTALQAFNKVIEQKPDWPEAYHYRGLAYADSGQYERALQDYRRAIELDPYVARAYNALGRAYRELAQFDQAKTNIDRAIELEPDFVLARENRAKLFDKQGDFQAELSELGVILGLSPGNQWAKDAKEAVLQKLGGKETIAPED